MSPNPTIGQIRRQYDGGASLAGNNIQDASTEPSTFHSTSVGSAWAYQAPKGSSSEQLRSFWPRHSMSMNARARRRAERGHSGRFWGDHGCRSKRLPLTMHGIIQSSKFFRSTVTQPCAHASRSCALLMKERENLTSFSNIIMSTSKGSKG